MPRNRFAIIMHAGWKHVKAARKSCMKLIQVEPMQVAGINRICIIRHCAVHRLEIS